MAHIRGQVTVDAPRELVFDTVADSRNEPGFNPAMREVQLLTPLPIGLGTRFRALMGRARTELVVEVTGFDRPNRLSSVTTSTMMRTSGSLTFADTPGGGTAMTWDWQVRPLGWLRLTGPLVGPLGRRMERRIWAAMARRVEAAGTTYPARAVTDREAPRRPHA